MDLYVTDKEYKERLDYYLEEVENDEGNKLDEPTRYLAILSVLMGNQGICAYEEVLEKALDVLSPVQVKEMVYQATDYLGYGRMLEFLKVTNEVFTKKTGISVWKCRNCGNIVVSKSAPAICPVCSKAQAYFELNVENY